MPELLSFQWIARKVNAARRRFQSSVEDVPFVRDEDRYVWALDNGPEMDQEVRQTLEPIDALSRLLKHHGIPLVVATYPQPWQVAADATPLPPIRTQYAIGMNTRAFERSLLQEARAIRRRSWSSVPQCHTGVPGGAGSGGSVPAKRLPLQRAGQRALRERAGKLPVEPVPGYGCQTPLAAEAGPAESAAVVRPDRSGCSARTGGAMVTRPVGLAGTGATAGASLGRAFFSIAAPSMTT